MAEKASEKKKKGNVLSSFVVLMIVLSVLTVSVSTVSAQTPPPPVMTNIIVTADPAGIPADDESVSNINITTEWDGIPLINYTVFFEITDHPGGARFTNGEEEGWTRIDAEGKANTQLIAGTNDGEVGIRVYATGPWPTQENFTTVTLLPPPTLTPWNNITEDASTEVTISESECVYFNATPDQPIDTWRWFLDGKVQENALDEFTHCWAVGSVYYVAVNATNANGTSDTITWTVTVEDHTPPASITYLGSETGNFWINWSWTNPPDADFSHVMVYIDDSYVTNVSEPQNGYNGTYGPHATKTISTHTVDTSGNINEAWVYQTTTIPNNAPVMEELVYQPSQQIFLGQTVTIDANANDLDDDVLTYSCNHLEWFTDFNAATGIGSWTPSATGTYYADFGVSDGYDGGTDNETATIIVLGYGVDLKVEGAEYAEKTVAPGENATYLLTVTNIGSAGTTDTYTLIVENPNGADFALNRTTIMDLASGDTADVLLNVSGTGSEYVVNVTAASNTVPSVKDTVMTRTIVSAMGSITGKITYTCNETGIAGVTVNLTQDGGLADSEVTGVNGDYEFIDVTPGDYYVNASKSRFWDNSTEVTVTEGAAITADDMTLWLKGDLNGDCNINWDDLVAFALAYGTHVGDPNYNKLADLDSDGDVDWDDLVAFALVYGT